MVLRQGKRSCLLFQNVTGSIYSAEIGSARLAFTSSSNEDCFDFLNIRFIQDGLGGTLGELADATLSA